MPDKHQCVGSFMMFKNKMRGLRGAQTKQNVQFSNNSVRLQTVNELCRNEKSSPFATFAKTHKSGNKPFVMSRYLLDTPPGQF